MKRNFKTWILLGIVLSVLSVIGCQQVSKTDEPINEPAEARQDLEDQARETDIKDQEAIYQYINEIYPNQYSQEDFNKWQPVYLDITGNDQDEVVYTAPYGEGKLERFLFIEAGSEGYLEIPSDIELMKYGNTIKISDGFIEIDQEGGGSSTHVAIKSLYVYNQEIIDSTGARLAMEEALSTPDGHEIIGEIEGDWNEFVYTATKTSLSTNEASLLEKTKYVYDPSDQAYQLTYIEALDSNLEDQARETANQTLSLTGKLILVGTELGHGILLDHVDQIPGNQADQLFFLDKDQVMDFIPREYFTFYTEGRRSLKEELSGQISIEIKIKPDSYGYESERNVGWVDVVEVISVDGDINPEDKSAAPYLDEYYMDVLERAYTIGPDEIIQQDIRDMTVYNTDPDFKEAVDTLLERGYFIQMAEGDYYINETEEIYTDGEE